MPSGLRAKLRGLSAAASDAPKVKPRGGLLCYAERQDLTEGLMELPAAGLRRIGWSGRAFDARRCLFLDTETTGLSGGAGTVAFLVGVGFVEGDHFTIEQYLMRDYGDEPELIDRLANRMDGFDYVCTFNGRTFDMPLLEARFTLTRMRHRGREMANPGSSASGAARMEAAPGKLPAVAAGGADSRLSAHGRSAGQRGAEALF